MRSKLVLLFVVVISSVLFGCTEKEGVAPSDNIGKATETTQAPTTRMYKDVMGREIEIPTEPKRVVTISMTGELVALGRKPVGAAENWLKYLTDQEKSGIVNVSMLPGNMEQIASLSPDLIITPAQVTKPESIEAYTKIAPTVVVPFFGDALNRLTIAGDIMGLKKEATAWIDSYNAKGAELGKKLASASVMKEGQSGLVVQFTQKSMYSYPTSTFPTIYNVLGLKPPQEITNLTQGLQISEEALPKIAAVDHLFVITKFGEESFVNQIMNGPIWKSLPAVKNGHVYVISDRLSAGDAPALSWALDEVVRLMLKQ